MHRHQSKEAQIFLAVVDKAVFMAFGAIMAGTGRKRLIGTITQNFAGTRQDGDGLTVILMGVETNAGTGNQLSLNNLAPIIRINPHGSFLFAAAHVWNDLFLNGVEVDQYIRFLL